MSYTNIALFGAGGDIGAPILKALVNSNKFKVTAIGRKQSSVQVPSSVSLLKVDYGNHRELVEALRGQDAIVITLGDLATLEKNTRAIVEAAIEVGVKRVIPSDFGHDLTHLPGSSYPVFAPKHQINKYLAEKGSQIEYTAIATGVFFDWGLRSKFIGFDIPNRKVKIYGDGTHKFNATNVDSIADAVINILTNPTPFTNQHLRIHDFYVSQNEIKAALESIIGVPFEVERIDVDRLEKDITAALASGDYTTPTVYGLIKVYLLGNNSSSAWGEEDDTAAVGLVKKDLSTEIQKVVDSQ
ncbi:hypothetical protein PIIN_05849 [Serendipita indica DSM 11827]|uniref:NmrA-like domain-containing protein n=1 Tax=Serendipita indica (strain DSM 11827) TaxID=1109443 RepID=G4TKS1_SERID|nr:hypothetical protein PIIN_05849 [Serendipita indica DSM 11827]